VRKVGRLTEMTQHLVTGWVVAFIFLLNRKE
jgi:hypothetical protein